MWLGPEGYIQEEDLGLEVREEWIEDPYWEVKGEFEGFVEENDEFLEELEREGDGRYWDSGIDMEGYETGGESDERGVVRIQLDEPLEDGGAWGWVPKVFV